MIQDILASLAARLDIPGFPWKKLVFGFSVTHFCFKSWLLYRQFKVYQRKTIPKQLVKEVDQSTFDKSQAYNREKSKVTFVESLISEVQSGAFLYYNVLPLAWHVSGSIVRSYFPVPFSGEITQSMVFIAIQSAFTVVASAPIGYYKHFVLEEKFGFNKMTKGLWITDKIKNFALSLAISAPFVTAAVKLVNWGGQSFFYYLWMFVAAYTLFMVTITPMYITPLFNKLSPVENVEVKTRLEALCKEVKFPLGELLEIDGSKRSSHSNAYFTGLPWKKQIVLFDTLVKDAEPHEIEGVLAHEIGHWSMNHIIRMIGTMQAMFFGIFVGWSCFMENTSMFTDFGFGPDEKPILVGLMLFVDVIQPLLFFISWRRNLTTQKMEYEADKYAADLGRADSLARALVRLQIGNLSAMDTDPLYSQFHFSHPILIERLKALEWVNDGEAVVSPDQQKSKLAGEKAKSEGEDSGETDKAVKASGVEL